MIIQEIEIGIVVATENWWWLLRRRRRLQLYRETLAGPLTPAPDSVAFMAASHTRVPLGTVPCHATHAHTLVPCHWCLLPLFPLLSLPLPHLCRLNFVSYPPILLLTLCCSRILLLQSPYQSRVMVPLFTASISFPLSFLCRTFQPPQP